MSFNLNHSFDYKHLKSAVHLAAILTLAVSALTVSGCLSGDSKEAVIQNTIKDIEANRATFIAANEGLFSDYTAFRDPTNPDTVIVETTHTAGNEPKMPIDKETFTKDIVDVFKEEKKLVQAVQVGVNIMMRYKTADGNTYFEYTITAKDLP